MCCGRLFDGQWPCLLVEYFKHHSSTVNAYFTIEEESESKRGREKENEQWIRTSHSNESIRCRGHGKRHEFQKRKEINNIIFGRRTHAYICLWLWLSMRIFVHVYEKFSGTFVYSEERLKQEHKHTQALNT